MTVGMCFRRWRFKGMWARDTRICRCVKANRAVRPDEIIRLTWADINLKTKTVRVDGKTRRRRIVTNKTQILTHLSKCLPITGPRPTIWLAPNLNLKCEPLVLVRRLSTHRLPPKSFCRQVREEFRRKSRREANADHHTN